MVNNIKNFSCGNWYSSVKLNLFHIFNCISFLWLSSEFKKFSLYNMHILLNMYLQIFYASLVTCILSFPYNDFQRAEF